MKIGEKMNKDYFVEVILRTKSKYQRADALIISIIWMFRSHIFSSARLLTKSSIPEFGFLKNRL